IDLANSQPLILGFLAMQLLTSSKDARSRLLNRRFDKKKGPYTACNKALNAQASNIQTNPPTQPAPYYGVQRPASPTFIRDLRNWLPATINLPADVIEFLRVCEAGKFYESLMTEEEKERGKPYLAKFKRRFFAVLCGPNASKKRWPNELKRRFRR